MTGCYRVRCCRCQTTLEETGSLAAVVARLLPCDCFVRYTCAGCGEESLERLHVSW